MSDESTPEVHICSICGKMYNGFGNNAWPINEDRCCDQCNDLVIMARLREFVKQNKQD